MSLRLLQKQVGSSPSDTSAEAKAATQPQGRSRPGRGGGSYRGDHDRGGYGSGGAGGYYGNSAGNDGGRGDHNRGSGGYVAAPPPPSRFHGSDAQRAHIDAMRRATAEAGPAAASAPAPGQEVALKSNIGLEALKEKKRQEEEERRAKREAAKAKRQEKVLDKEREDEQALGDCEEQARLDCQEHERLKYEAALVVRIAVRFGSSDVWMKMSEARARGADIPLDTRKVYLLAHPDRNPLPEATDATAILNAQRPPEMTEARPRPPAAAAPAAPAPAAPAAAPEAAPAAAGAAAAGAAAAAAESSPGTGSAAGVGAAAPAAEEERRVDPEDNQRVTLEELRQKYEGTYAAEEIEAYWNDDCRPLPKPRPASRRY